MKQKTTNRMDLGSKAIKLCLALAVASTSLANAQENERNTPGGGTPVRNVVVTPFCPTISSLNMVDMGSDKAIISWTSTLNFDSIYFRIAPAGSTTWRYIGISGTPNPGRYMVLGLDPLTSYDIEVSTKCQGFAQSPWSTALTVTTFAPQGPPRLANNNRNINYLNIAPNPVSNTAYISFTATINQAQQVVITNSTSQVVYKTTVIPAIDKVMVTVDVSNFPIGVYFVKVSNSNGVSVERMVIQ